MRYEIILTPEAVKDLRRKRAYERAVIKDALEQKLRFQPKQVSKSGIKRLRGLAKPQYCLRLEDVRVFYDVHGDEVVVLAILDKDEVEAWLVQHGEWTDETNGVV